MKNGLLFSLLLLLTVGCGQESATTYQAPKQKTTPGTMQAPSMAAIPAQPASTGFSATLPDGWTETAGSGMRIVSYTIDGTSIDFYLISLMMGDVTSNVNRWRGQVNLSAATPEAIAEDVVSFDADGHKVNYIEIYNEDGGKGIIAAIMDMSPAYWYFTAKGSVSELKAHEADIRSFLESLTLD